MAIPVINMEALEGESRSKTMSLLHEACAKWGFFWVQNHGVDKDLVEEVSKMVNLNYDTRLKEEFYNLDMAKELKNADQPLDGDWESSFFFHHQPNCNLNDTLDLNSEFHSTMRAYVKQLIRLAEKLSELMSENLGLDKDHIKNTFSEPFVGTKIAKYPQCPKPELVMGLRAHTDAGGIIMLLQDDTIPGLEFFKDGEWVQITPSKEKRIFINIGDQVEVVTNGLYKSILHRVRATKDGSRLSIATFYNPGADAVITPAPKLLYPSKYRFQDYLDYYFETKFSDKLARFQSIKMMTQQSYVGA